MTSWDRPANARSKSRREARTLVTPALAGVAVGTASVAIVVCVAAAPSSGGAVMTAVSARDRMRLSSARRLRPQDVPRVAAGVGDAGCS